jgi:hypothetical protein
MSDFQATWLHLFIITEYCHNQGLQVCLVIAGLPCHSKTALPCHSKTAGQVCRASLPGKSTGQVCRASLPGKSAGQVCRAGLPGKSAGQVCQASLPGKSAGQVCRACPIKIRNGCSLKKIPTDFKSDHIWSRLIMSDQVSDHVWSCLIMCHQLSAEIVPSLIKGRHSPNTNNNKAKCIPGG